MAKKTDQRDQLILAGKEFLFPAVFHYYDDPLVVESAKDQYVWDVEGRQYLDFFGGIVTISVGHLNEQGESSGSSTAGSSAARFDAVHHSSSNRACGTHCEGLSPNAKLTKSFFTNSGSEANETAIELARCYTGNTEVIALRHSYHGRTSGGRALTGQGPWRGPGTPQPGIVHAHSAYCYRCPFGLSYPSCDVACARDVKELVETSTSGRLAAFLAEPIQGIGGFITPPKEYFSIVDGNRARTRRHFHQRRSADRVGADGQVVRHRALRCRARRHDDGQGSRQRLADRSDDRSAGDRGFDALPDAVDVRGEPGHGGGGQGRDRLRRRTGPARELARCRRLSARPTCCNSRTSSRSSAMSAEWDSCRHSSWSGTGIRESRPRGQQRC